MNRHPVTPGPPPGFFWCATRQSNRQKVEHLFGERNPLSVSNGTSVARRKSIDNIRGDPFRIAAQAIVETVEKRDPNPLPKRDGNGTLPRSLFGTVAEPFRTGNSRHPW